MRFHEAGGSSRVNIFYIRGDTMSKFRSTVSIIATATALLALASCANTIKGVGKDTAGAVNATQSAAHSVERAARK